MSAIAIFLLAVLIITALLLIILVLLQDDSGEGLGGIFGGGSSQQIGSRSGNILTHITSILATIFLVSTLTLAWLSRSAEVDNVEQAARALNQTESESLQWWQVAEDITADVNIDQNLLDTILENN